MVVTVTALWLTADSVHRRRIDVFRDDSRLVQPAATSCSAASPVCGHYACTRASAQRETRSDSKRAVPTLVDLPPLKYLAP